MLNKLIIGGIVAASVAAVSAVAAKVILKKDGTANAKSKDKHENLWEDYICEQIPAEMRIDGTCADWRRVVKISYEKAINSATMTLVNPNDHDETFMIDIDGDGGSHFLAATNKREDETNEDMFWRLISTIENEEGLPDAVKDFIFDIYDPMLDPSI